jgi:hypothetical protein
VEEILTKFEKFIAPTTHVSGLDYILHAHLIGDIDTRKHSRIPPLIESRKDLGHLYLPFPCTANYVISRNSMYDDRACKGLCGSEEAHGLTVQGG